MTETLTNSLLLNSDQPSRKSRLFEVGHMKLLVLSLIEQAPLYGYEIIKSIGDLVGGGYSPSTGTIYPTLSYLEDMQFILIDNSDSDRKQYTITVAGINHLKDKRELLESILGRLKTRREIQNNDHYLDIYRAMENLKTSLRLKFKNSILNEETVRQIAKSIDQAAVAISCIKNEEKS
ncbi:PadR family transcriptional regulator [Acinetobacter sp. ANC 4779]|uniref:PadR family transcriptional regulator n=1 Tax=Acinetobacter sp. ANC 4779 TaxID=2529848 RepID=UPI00103890FE|nr:PadR family transcriptional regulator [Acinetobacter sp. ANC 4779]TCB50923.1 PadR family transcriptional regulator [Acinetobacter sp. ANC 4779]